MLLDDHADTIGSMEAVAIEYKAGDASFHNGLTAHGAGPNFTPYSRRAMTLQMMPADAKFAGKQNILTAERFASLTAGDHLAVDEINPAM
jgi:ectoine hydroxylase-related dioxygenase (phytanoyl-CoA dioxygenase family)